MTSELVRFDSGLWTPIQPGRVHAAEQKTFSTGGHHNFYTSKNIDSKLIGKTCLICGQFTLVNFGPGGAFCANIRTANGFASLQQTFYSNREWTGGSSFPGGNLRTGIFLFQLTATPSASTITLQARIDMGGAGNITEWSAGDNQSNMFIFPVDF